MGNVIIRCVVRVVVVEDVGEVVVDGVEVIVSDRGIGLEDVMGESVEDIKCKVEWRVGCREKDGWVGVVRGSRNEVD